jgi:hypothetical protein
MGGCEWMDGWVRGWVGGWVGVWGWGGGGGGGWEGEGGWGGGWGGGGGGQRRDRYGGMCMEGVRETERGLVKIRAGGRMCM